MPTYDYHCENCGCEFEQFQSITARPLRKCPECGKAAPNRLIGTGAGIIFKGSGFYETDYRSESYKKAEKKEKDLGKEKKDQKKSETKKSETKEPKPAKSQKKKEGEKKSA